MADEWDTLSGADHDLLKPTYRMSRFVLDDMIHKGTLYDLDQKINLTQIGVTNFKHWDGDTWDEIFAHYGGFTLCLAIALFLVVALLVGAICCCCVCCCKCCKRKKTSKNCADISTTNSSSRQKKMSIVEVVCLVLFLLIIGAMLMGVVIMFVSRSALQKELKYDKVYTKVENTAIEAEKFVEDTWDDAQRTVLGIYSRAQGRIMGTLKAIPNAAQKLVETKSDAKVILDKQKLFYETISGSADAVDNITTTLREDATSVGDELSRLSDELTRLVPNCDAEQPCQTALSGLSVSADYTGLQNLNDISQTASEAENVTEKGYAEIDKVQGDVLLGIEPSIIEVENAMNDGYKEVTKFTNDTKKTIRDLNLVKRVQDYDKKSTRDDVEKYLDIFYGCTAALCCLLLPVIVLYLGGLVFGLFGNEYNTSCSCFRKSKAPCMIKTGAYLLFFLLILVILVSFVLLIAGGIIHTETCRYFGRTKKYQPSLNTIDNIIREEINIDVKYVEAVVACERDVTLFDALGFVELDTLDTSLDDTMDPDEYNITGELDGLGSVIITLTNVNLLHEDKLLAVNDSLNELDYDSYQDALSANVTEGDLSTLIDDLVQYTNTSSDPSAFATLLEDLRAVEVKVSSMEEKQARGISEITTIRDTAQGQPIQGQIDELREAEKTIDDDADDVIDTVIDTTVAGLLKTVEKLFEELEDAIETKIGRCGPLHTTVYGLLSYVCVDVLYPLNALWFGMGWFVLFAIISMFVAFKVASIFQVHQATKHYYSDTYSPEPVYVKNSYM